MNYFKCLSLVCLQFLVACTYQLSNMESFKIKIGDTTTYSLPSNPTTGYAWLTDIDDPKLISITSNYQNNSTSKGAIGSGLQHQFRIAGLKKGSTKIHFKYMRPWETDAKPDQTKTIEIVVE